MSMNRHRVRVGRLAALLCSAAAAAAFVAPVAAQTGRATVGNLRIGDDNGQSIWEQPAPAGEKLFKAPAGTKQFKVWYEYDGTTTKRAVFKVIAPQGVFTDIQEQELTAPGTFSIDFSFDEPLADAEYLVNAYVDVDGKESLADGLTLLVGEAAVIPPDNVQQATTGAPAAGIDPAQPVAGAPGAVGGAGTAPQAGEPSQLLLFGSGLGVIVLLAIVVWAGMSALKQR